MRNKKTHQPHGVFRKISSDGKIQEGTQTAGKHHGLQRFFDKSLFMMFIKFEVCDGGEFLASIQFYAKDLELCGGFQDAKRKWDLEGDEDRLIQRRI